MNSIELSEEDIEKWVNSEISIDDIKEKYEVNYIREEDIDKIVRDYQ